MPVDTPDVIYLKDYTPPPYLIDRVSLDIDIQTGQTIVTAKLDCRRNPQLSGCFPCALQGEALETLSVSLDGIQLANDAYCLSDTQLILDKLPETFVLETRVRIRPEQNTQLSGFYRSRDGYVTQCEPQGFRRITWFLDRPDVMGRYTVTLRADKAALPVLLANGNPVTCGDLPDGRHFATWEDPFPKPSYLFAMVAGKLDVLRDTYRTASGREVQLAIYVESGKLDQCDHAMAALKKSMRWDEERFGLECDLDHYMIVAVGDFNMGAMENKGLNVFNTKYVLARADVATDVDFENIDRVVAHEYFHNWTGNRVTCRDWFQLSLKEGLTVFRDQEFGADLHCRETARIREVRGLRAIQFPEDAGPMAHPVRPASYIEINNFYTATVYEKGAEVVRMIHTLIGEAAFRRGMDRYFARHDGQAVCCEDFVAALLDGTDVDQTQFLRWYEQAGTPRLAATGEYDATARRYTLRLKQSCTPSPGQPEKRPYLIPVAVGLIGQDGAEFDLGGGQTTRVLRLCEPEQSFVFENITSKPVPSILRNFSAPVVLEDSLDDEALTHQLTHDSDPFNCWEAGQRLFGRLILDAAACLVEGRAMAWPPAVLAAAERVLVSDRDPAFIAEVLSLPGEATLAEQMVVVDPEALFQARTGLSRFLASGLEATFAARYAALAVKEPYSPSSAQAGCRRLRNLCLAYLNEINELDELGNDAHRALARCQLATANNMTDELAALAVLANASAVPGASGGEEALGAFYTRWQDEDLVVDKWLAVQAACRLSDTLARVEYLTGHPAFDLKNPNKVYALLRTFGGNHRHFHAADGGGYRFLAEQIARLDPINPQVASRLARCFDRWRRFDAGRQQYARTALEGLRRREGLSRDVFEVVDKALGG